jgi:hypothetical protein
MAKKWIVSETDTGPAIVLRAASLRARRAECGLHLEMIPLDDAAELVGSTVSSLRERIRNGGGHVLEPDGTSWVCAVCLSRLSRT